MKSINLFNNDALKVMKEMVNNGEKVDCIITDPPYGKINGLELQGTPHKKIDWDSKIDWKTFFELAFKITNQIIIFGQNPTYAQMILSSPYYKYDIIWKKNNCAQGFHFDKMPLIYTEYIGVFIKDSSKRIFNKQIENKKMDEVSYPLRSYSHQLQKWIIEKNNLKSRKAIYQGLPKINRKGIMKLDRRLEFFFFFNGSLFNKPAKEAYQTLVDIYKINEWDNFLTYNQIKEMNIEKEAVYNAEKLSLTTKNILEIPKENGKSFHPTQKPIKLMEKLVQIYSNENDTVFDPFMGSGSTGVACVKNNRKFIGIELDEKYYNIAKERIKND